MDVLDTLFHAAMAGDVDAIAELEMEADTLFRDEETILHQQSKKGNTERVRFILREFPHKNLLTKLSRDQETALHLAIYQGRTEVAEILIDAAYHLLPPSNDEVTSFQAFLRQGDKDSNTALHAAVMKVNLAIVKLLVEADRTDTHIQNDYGKTPMYIAVEQGSNDMVEIISTTCTAPSLLGPRCSALVRTKDMEQAKRSGGSLYKIMDKDALFAAAIARDSDAIAALEMHADTLDRDDRSTILHTESGEGNTEHVRFILREFAHKNLLPKLTSYNNTALHRAILREFAHKNLLSKYSIYNNTALQVAEVLIDAARHFLPPSDNDDNPKLTSFQAFLRQGDKDMDTTLHTAVMTGNLAIVKLLVEADPSDTHIQNNKGKTPMYMAVEQGNNDMVEIISTTCTAPSLLGPDSSTLVRIKNLDEAESPSRSLYEIMDKDALYAAAIAGDADATAALEMHAHKLHGCYEATILHTESEMGNTEHVRFILREFAADKNLLVKLNNCKQTALHLASYRGHTEVAEVLINNAARHLLNIDDVTSFQAFLRQADHWMHTALHIAVRMGNVGLVKLLVEADPTDSHTRNNAGETPMYIAAESGYYNIVKMICTTCTAPLDLDAPGGRTTVLHTLFNNADRGKEEYRRHTIRQITETVINNYGDEQLRNLIQLFLKRTDEKRCTILELAVERNYSDTVELILAQLDVEINQLTSNRPMCSCFMSIKPLIYKVMDKGYTNMFNLLTRTYETYERWAEPFAADVAICKMPQLISAISRREKELVSDMLKYHFGKLLVTFADNLGWTALHHAAYHEFDIIIPAILEAQREVQHPFVYPNMLSTPFHVAAAKGHTSTVICLMQSWPSGSSAYTDVDKNEQNILHLAALQSKKEMVQGILKYCSEEFKKEFVNKQDKNGDTPLHILIRRGCFIPEFMRYEGLDIRVENKKRWNPPLYSDEEITDDQVQIKIALYDLHPTKDIFADAIAGDAMSIAALKMKANKVNELGETILHVESKKGEIQNVRCILRAADKNLLVKLNNRKQTALHLALSEGYTELAEILISAARDLLPNDDNNPVTSFLRQADEWMETVLHYAVRMGNVDLVKLLVEADPTDSHTRNNGGETPIYIAAESGYYDIVKIICTTCTVPLDLDAPDGSTTVLHLLINNADPEKEDDRNAIRQITEVIINKCGHEKFMELLDRSDEKRCIILELAVKRDFMDMVELILAQLAVEINYMDIPSLMLSPESGGTLDRMSSRLMGLAPLIFEAMDKENYDMFNLLARPFAIYHTKAAARMFNLSKVPVFISTISNRQEESLIYMLEQYYAETLVTFADNLGWTALHHAAYNEFDRIIHPIIEAQKIFKYSFVYQDMLSTPFHIAAEKGYTSTMKCLMQSWPSSSSAYTVVDKYEQNILHLAALQSKKEMIQDILKYCSEESKTEFVNKQDNNGDTPLHILIRRGCFIPELLKYEGLDKRVKNKEGWTALDMLYYDEQDIDNQVQIKIVLDGFHPSNDIFSNSVSPSKRMRKDRILNEQAKLKINGKYAAMKGDTDAIATCFADAIAGDAISVAALKMKADKVNELEETILHVESNKGDIENVRFIVSEFANKSLLGKLDISKQTALHLAAQRGHIQVVEALIIGAARLLPSSANDDAHNSVGSFQVFIRQANVPNLNTALHLAVLDGNVAIVKLLVEADPNDSHVRNSEGKTPIYIAAEKGRKDIIKVICKACTYLSLDGPEYRTTALHALIQNMDRGGEIDVIGMMVDKAKHRSSEQNASAADFEELFSRKDKSERTILELAVERNDVNAVALILREDPAYQSGGEMKRNDLMRVICKAIDNDYSDDIVKSLSEAYKSGITDHDPDEVLALILAIHKLDKDSVLHLLGKAKKLVTFTEDNGWTPLHYAVYYEFDLILDAIIKAQNDVEHPFVYRKMETTPFYVAVKHGYTSMLIRLMELWPALSSFEDSPYTTVTKDGQNILHLAAAADAAENKKVVIDSAHKRKAAADNRKEMVQGILKYCPRKYKDDMLKQQDINGDTPLHLIISHGCFIPELVKHKGLDTTTKNKKDFTPMDMLYVEDAIVEDQVHIKVAIDDVQNDQSVWKLWGKRAEKETGIWKYNKTSSSKRKNKDVKFEVEKKVLEKKMHKQRRDDLERYKTRTNTQILVTALITTVTFTVGFTMPGGLHQSGEVGEGLVVLSKRRAFNIFMMSDALALLMSTSSLFLYFLESMNDDPHEVSLLNASSTVLNILSIMGMMLTFIAGTYVVLSDSRALAIAVCITGSLFFLLILMWIVKIAYDRHIKRNKD